MKQKDPKWMTWKKKYPGRHLNPLDILILKFLWKWKVSTVATLREAVASGQNHNTFNKRIRKLETNGLIECERVLIPSLNLWQLTDHGCYAIRESLGPIKDEGYRSASHYHDALVLAFQMGEWLWQSNEKPKLITDQELLRYPKDYLDECLPKSLDHRPDGYTIVKRENKEKVLAFEVELHAKSTDRYSTVVRWYDVMREVERVFWLVNDEYIINQFKKGKSEAKGKTDGLHLFIRLDEYLKSGWDRDARRIKMRDHMAIAKFCPQGTIPSLDLVWLEPRGRGRKKIKAARISSGFFDVHLFANEVSLVMQPLSIF